MRTFYFSFSLPFLISFFSFSFFGIETHLLSETSKRSHEPLAKDSARNLAPRAEPPIREKSEHPSPARQPVQHPVPAPWLESRPLHHQV
jgi:hypothetical protein